MCVAIMEIIQISEDVIIMNVKNKNMTLKYVYVSINT